MFYFHPIRLGTNNPNFIVPMLIKIVTLTSILVTMLSGIATADKKTPREEIIFQHKTMLGDFDEMVQLRTIRALVVYSKTFYFIDRGRQYGISYEALKTFEKFVNKKLQTKTLKIQVVFIPVSRDELIPSLLNGQGDIAAANLTITGQRQKQVDFSNPFGSGVKELLVTGPSAPSIKSIDDLAGKEIHVRRSSSYYESLLQLNTSFKKARKPQMKLVLADETFEDEDLLEMVNAGLIPMIVMDSHKAQFWQQIFDNITVHQDIAVRTGGEIAWAFRKNSPKLKAVVNEFAKRHKEGTMLRNILLKRYFKNTKFVKNALSEKELKKYNSKVQLFKKYAGEYDFNYLMIVAQAYQESGLDHSKRSPAGAVGIMQLLPTTATDPNVNITNIEKLENNIHAGTKYLRFVIDRYYKDEPMDEVNKLLFAFASYNAGPARVKELRKKAAAMGLNPNVWFHNVEIAAAKSIGRETVQYVSNIYKYFISYQMVLMQAEKKQASQAK
ncbi:MAG: lytic transglycosylase F [Desulfobacteraceae bacterium]|nr:lytic transglycosylase F [Desulfobacteraceae bacterium]MDH3836820.1 lytic transglycosylase F [Desulfobacteraceae bacterium]MDH3875691.1 lytic transglycosylase F [Desulfobacteraceae bacterium]